MLGHKWNRIFIIFYLGFFKLAIIVCLYYTHFLVKMDLFRSQLITFFYIGFIVDDYRALLFGFYGNWHTQQVL